MKDVVEFPEFNGFPMLRDLFEKHVFTFFGDLRALLLLPSPAISFGASMPGGNFAVLYNVGVKVKSGERFRGVLVGGVRQMIRNLAGSPDRLKRAEAELKRKYSP